MGSIGLAVSQSMVLTVMLQMAARFTADFLAQMTSVERVLEYMKLPSEEHIENGRKNVDINATHSKILLPFKCNKIKINICM